MRRDVRNVEPFHGVEPVLLDPLGVRVGWQGRARVGGERGDQGTGHRARGAVKVETDSVLGVQRRGVDTLADAPLGDARPRVRILVRVRLLAVVGATR